MQNKSAWSAFLSTSMLFLSAWTCQGQSPKTDSLRYLALGDSYTIGTSVEPLERFPIQLVKALQKRGVAIQKPKIVARVGWSSDQLSAAMDRENLEGSTWDWVTLLIGVNNQYRGGSLEQYQLEFKVLLQRAIQLAGGQTHKVIVLSIPDYGVTPFGQRLQAARISREIDAFNASNRQISASLGVKYCDITPISREALKNKALIADDKLHPSGEMYRRWVELLLPLMD
jgi:lysophospholipase L1-like esterase